MYVEKRPYHQYGNRSRSQTDCSNNTQKHSIRHFTETTERYCIYAETAAPPGQASLDSRVPFVKM